MIDVETEPISWFTHHLMKTSWFTVETFWSYQWQKVVLKTKIQWTIKYISLVTKLIYKFTQQLCYNLLCIDTFCSFTVEIPEISFFGSCQLPLLQPHIPSYKTTSYPIPQIHTRPLHWLYSLHTLHIANKKIVPLISVKIKNWTNGNAHINVKMEREGGGQANVVYLSTTVVPTLGSFIMHLAFG